MQEVIKSVKVSPWTRVKKILLHSFYFPARKLAKWKSTKWKLSAISNCKKKFELSKISSITLCQKSKILIFPFGSLKCWCNWSKCRVAGLNPMVWKTSSWAFFHSRLHCKLRHTFTCDRLVEKNNNIPDGWDRIYFWLDPMMWDGKMRNPKIFTWKET